MTGEATGTGVAAQQSKGDIGLSGFVDVILFVAVLGFSAIALLAFALAAPLAIAVSAVLAAASAFSARNGRRGGWRTVGAV